MSKLKYVVQVEHQKVTNDCHLFCRSYDWVYIERFDSLVESWKVFDEKVAETINDAKKDGYNIISIDDSTTGVTIIRSDGDDPLLDQWVVAMKSVLV